jgi:molybdopterin molybdotransferase
METVASALEKVLQEAQPLRPAQVDLPEAVGLVLAETVVSDMDAPPFAKALVDGYALQSRDISEGRRRFRLVGTVRAGEWFSGAVEAGQAVRIMTGAPVPTGADMVVMLERGREVGEWVELEGELGGAGAYVMPRGAEMRAGDIVFRRGTVLKPAHIAVLASIGQAKPFVFPRPRVNVVPTGDELVDVACRPGPGQIRNSNGPMLWAAAHRAGANVTLLPPVVDQEELLYRTLERALSDADVVLVSGGVSMGDRDLVPKVLTALGVRQVFHRVRLRPGQPLWFGVHKAPGRRALVFGLPGNPVSSLVCFYLFAKPALRVLMGHDRRRSPEPLARLRVAWEHRAARPTYWPARLWVDRSGMVAEPLPWQGSSDMRTVTLADGFLFVDQGEHRFQAGDEVQVLVID